LGREIPKEQLIELLPMIGSDIEHYDDEMLRLILPKQTRLLQCSGISRQLEDFLVLKLDSRIQNINQVIQ